MLAGITKEAGQEPETGRWRSRKTLRRVTGFLVVRDVSRVELREIKAADPLQMRPVPFEVSRNSSANCEVGSFRHRDSGCNSERKRRLPSASSLMFCKASVESSTGRRSASSSRGGGQRRGAEVVFDFHARHFEGVIVRLLLIIGLIDRQAPGVLKAVIAVGVDALIHQGGRER